MRSSKPVSSIPGDVYHHISLQKSKNWQLCDVQFRGLCGQMPCSTMEDSHSGQKLICHVALYVPQLWVSLLVDCHLHWFGLTHIRSHASCYAWSFRFHVLLLNVGPGSYVRWLQLQHRGGPTGVCVSAVSYRVAHCSKRLSFGSIRLQSHLVEVFLEPRLAVVEWWGRWSRKEVGSPEDYIVSYKSKCNEWQPTCTFNSSWIRLHIAALRRAAGDSTSPAICSMSVRWCLFVYRDTLW